MLSLILTLSMVPAASTTPVIAQPQQTAQVTTCQWPHRCATEVVAPVAQVQTCVWPHVCAQTPADVQPVIVASVQTCVWPHVCADAAAL